MKGIIPFFPIMLFLGLFASTNILTSHSVPIAGTQCDSPTQFVSITSSPGIKYDLQSINVNPATCVEITISNVDLIPHDFTIDGSSNMEEVYIPVNGDQIDNFKVGTPNLDITFSFYCSVIGHRASGEEGTFIIGTGTVSSSETSTHSDEEDSSNSSLNVLGSNYFILQVMFSLITLNIVFKIRNAKNYY